MYCDEGPERRKSLVTFRADVSERQTRATSSGLLETCRCSLESTRMTVPVRAVRGWNALDRELRENGNKQSFKKRVKRATMQ